MAAVPPFIISCTLCLLYFRASRRDVEIIILKTSENLRIATLGFPSTKQTTLSFILLNNNLHSPNNKVYTKLVYREQPNLLEKRTIQNTSRLSSLTGNPISNSPPSLLATLAESTKKEQILTSSLRHPSSNRNRLMHSARTAFPS